MMKIAFLIPSLANKGPIIVVKDIVTSLVVKKGFDITVFYFSDQVELDFPCLTRKVGFFDFRFLKGFQIVHSHGIRPDLYLKLNNKINEIKKISTTHNIVYEEYKSNYNHYTAKLIEIIWKFSLSEHDHIVCLTQIMKNYYKNLMPNSSFFVVNNGRKLNKDNNLVLSDDSLFFNDLKKNYKIIGTACVVTKRKGLHQIIKVLPFLKDYCFVIIGEGEEIKKLNELALNLGVTERCFFLGYRSNVSGYYSLFDYYVISSYSEGLPLALLEAAQFGLPSLCSDIEIHRELFSEKEVVFFELDKKESLISAIKIIDKKTKFYSENIFNKYMSHYTSEKMVNKYVEIYNHAIK